jgi:hypothetical protein
MPTIQVVTLLLITERMQFFLPLFGTPSAFRSPRCSPALSLSHELYVQYCKKIIK